MDVLAPFAGNVLAGVVASFLTVAILRTAARLRLRQFAQLAGSYEHVDRDGQVVNNGRTVVRYAGANVLETSGSGIDGKWRGRVLMHLDFPMLGTGQYQYDEKIDCGLHLLQRQPNGSVAVTGVNTSHGKNFVFSYVWRPCGDAPEIVGSSTTGGESAHAGDAETSKKSAASS